MFHVAMLAEAGTGATVSSGIDEIVGLLPKATSIATAVWDFGMANPLIAITIVGAVITVGASIIAGIRHSVR